MRMYMKLLLSVLLLVLAQPLAAEELRTVTPEAVGLSSERLARIGAVMQAHIDAGRFPGAVALIARKGELAYLEHWGATTPASIFRIYSMTKPVTSVAVMSSRTQHFESGMPKEGPFPRRSTPGPTPPAPADAQFRHRWRDCLAYTPRHRSPAPPLEPPTPTPRAI